MMARGCAPPATSSPPATTAHSLFGGTFLVAATLVALAAVFVLVLGVLLLFLVLLGRGRLFGGRLLAARRGAGDDAAKDVSGADVEANVLIDGAARDLVDLVAVWEEVATHRAFGRRRVHGVEVPPQVD